jgi:hypothetical protein
MEEKEKEKERVQKCLNCKKELWPFKTYKLNICSDTCLSKYYNLEKCYECKQFLWENISTKPGGIKLCNECNCKCHTCKSELSYSDICYIIDSYKVCERCYFYQQPSYISRWMKFIRR